MGLVSQIHCLHQSWTSELIFVCVRVCVCVVTFSLHLSCAHLLSITYFLSPTPFFSLSFSLSVANPACVGVDNKLSGEERLEEIESVGFSSAH